MVSGMVSGFLRPAGYWRSVNSQLSNFQLPIGERPTRKSPTAKSSKAKLPIGTWELILWWLGVGHWEFTRLEVGRWTVGS
jgi:hypothetical protein